MYTLQLTLSGFSFKYGGSPSIISIAIIPKLQMSTFGPYSFLVTTSGAILKDLSAKIPNKLNKSNYQYGVPTIVVRLVLASLSCAQKPKSAEWIVGHTAVTSDEIHLLSLISPFNDSKTLSLFMSL
jgi:hypothetical protein